MPSHCGILYLVASYRIMSYVMSGCVVLYCVVVLCCVLCCVVACCIVWHRIMSYQIIDARSRQEKERHAMLRLLYMRRHATLRHDSHDIVRGFDAYAMCSLSLSLSLDVHHHIASMRQCIHNSGTETSTRHMRVLGALSVALFSAPSMVHSMMPLLNLLFFHVNVEPSSSRCSLPPCASASS